ncbi:hypothetical protein GGS26DRAFT_587579 [Hypomontagnella submonticulosa]|nr:hypothetical protein GGS26DRAFT_587579 [Hypomontagnella submonticulosa]
MNQEFALPADYQREFRESTQTPEHYFLPGDGAQFPNGHGFGAVMRPLRECVRIERQIALEHALHMGAAETGYPANVEYPRFPPFTILQWCVHVGPSNRMLRDLLDVYLRHFPEARVTPEVYSVFYLPQEEE